ncbi:hypothetical protein D1872_281090 [compost metagenome]
MNGCILLPDVKSFDEFDPLHRNMTLLPVIFRDQVVEHRVYMEHRAAARQTVDFTMNQCLRTGLQTRSLCWFAILIYDQEILRCTLGFVFTTGSDCEVKALG